MQRIFNIGLSHRRYDDNGYLFVDSSPVLRSGILEYLGSELIDGGSNYIDDVKINPDKLYKVFLPIEELEKAKDSFNLIPIVNDHTWLGEEGKDAKDYQEGMTGEISYVKDGKLYVSMKFTGKGIIDDIEAGKEELSASYTNILSASNNPEYDFIARDYKGNHIALVDRGRCGEDVRVLNKKPNYPYVSDRDKAIAIGIAVMVADAYLKAQNNFKESEHPRDDDGKFTDGTGTSSSKDNTETFTPIEEIQKKIDSVKIDFTKDNILPELNKEDLEEVGFPISKPVLLKKSIIDRNLTEHPEVKKEDYDKMIGNSLYNPEYVFLANKEKPYFNFIKRLEHDNSLVLLEFSDNKENLEIVHIHWINDKKLRKMHQFKSELGGRAVPSIV